MQLPASRLSRGVFVSPSLRRKCIAFLLTCDKRRSCHDQSLRLLLENPCTTTWSWGNSCGALQSFYVELEAPLHTDTSGDGSTPWASEERIVTGVCTSLPAKCSTEPGFLGYRRVTAVHQSGSRSQSLASRRRRGSGAPLMQCRRTDWQQYAIRLLVVKYYSSVTQTTSLLDVFFLHIFLHITATSHVSKPSLVT